MGANTALMIADAPSTQAMVGAFGVEKFGQPLFFPAATMTDADLGV